MKITSFLVILLLIPLVSCSSSTQEPTQQSTSIKSEEESSYQALLMVNGKEYISLGNMNKGQYTISKSLGKVESKLPPEVAPFDDFDSNYLEQGTEIYAIVESSDIILAKAEDASYEIFKMAGN